MDKQPQKVAVIGLDSTPSHCPSAKVEEYIESYVDHFNFRDKLRLGVSAEKVRRDDVGNRWVVDIQGSEPEYFDKVIMATGGNNRPHIPKVEGMDKFEGEVLHSRAFKRCVIMISVGSQVD
ncbi:hypothetical protein LB505_013395 [Fusarium chuoi]|nr:hypothetical protein LB505_013395 [Fusarium chuoi]